MMKLIAVGLLVIAPRPIYAGESVDITKEKSRLIHGHPAEQQAAIMKLANSGESGSEALADIVENEKDPMAKARAGRALQEAALKPENRSKKFFQRLKRLSENENSTVSEQGLIAVMNLKRDPEARKLIKESAKSRRDPQLRAKALGMLLVNTERDKSEVPFLAEFLNDPSEYVRVWAAGYLGELGDARALPFINEVLQRKPQDDKGRALIMRAAIAAGRIGDSSSLPYLAVIGKSESYGIAQWDALLAIKDIELKHKSTDNDRIQYLDAALNEPTYCRWAALKLSQIKGARVEVVLQQAAKSRNSQISTEAIQTLMSMGIKVAGHQH